MISILT